MEGLLSGIRVIDVTSNIAGPCATMILAELGAEVIKVERPDGGDDGRQMGPHQGEWGAYFVSINRGKRSLALDLRRPEGVEVALRLAARSDVFIENYRGGKAAELGLEEKDVRKVRPDLIYASLSAYGPQGPEYLKAGYDAVLQARTGIISVTGSAEGGYSRAGVSVLDMGSGIWVALGIIAALYERQRSGRGQRVDGSLFQTGVMWMAYHLVSRQFTGRDARPQGTRIDAFAPYGDFPTADGTLMIGISNDRLFARLCQAVGRTNWPTDSRFVTNRERVKNRQELDRELSIILQTKETGKWLEIFDGVGVPVGPVQSTGQLLKDKHLDALNQLVEIELPGLTGLSVSVPRLPLEFSAHPSPVTGPPPRLGEHSRGVLREAGFTEGEIECLIEQGIVQIVEPSG